MQWLRLHPLKAVLFTMILTAIATSAGFREDLRSELRLAFGVLALVLGIVMYTDIVAHRKLFNHENWMKMHNLMSLLLAGLFSYTSARGAEPAKQENLAAAGVAVVVVCVGGYCIYKVVKVCQKKFPPKCTNAPPEEFSASGVDEYGGAAEYSSIGSCYVMPPSLNSFPYEDLLQNPTTFTLTVSLQQGTSRVGMSANNEEGTTQTWDQFVSDFADHGLFLTGHPAYQPQYERDRIPCDAATVPLSLDPFTGKVTHNTGGELRHVTVERSPNLQDWYPLLVTDVSDNTGFQVVDTTREGQMFYRVSLQ